MTFANYADEIGLLLNTTDQDKFLLHSLEQVAGGFGLYGNAKKNDSMYFKQDGANST